MARPKMSFTRVHQHESSNILFEIYFTSSIGTLEYISYPNISAHGLSNSMPATLIILQEDASHPLTIPSHWYPINTNPVSRFHNSFSFDAI